MTISIGVLLALVGVCAFLLGRCFTLKIPQSMVDAAEAHQRAVEITYKELTRVTANFQDLAARHENVLVKLRNAESTTALFHVHLEQLLNDIRDFTKLGGKASEAQIAKVVHTIVYAEATLDQYRKETNCQIK